MFGTVTNLDEDLELDTSFFPVTTSTQSEEYLNEKRKHKDVVDENAKRTKIDEPETVGNPYSKTLNIEKSGTEKPFSPSRFAKRMFPGPAGLLTDIDNSSDVMCQSPNLNTEDYLLCSQHTVSTFMDKPWTMMKTDYCSIGREQLYDKYNISWIKKTYCQKNVSFMCKAPFLAAIIQNLETVDAKIPSVHITLKDPTGIIDGTILYSFYKGIANHLTVGSLVVLKQFGVLSNQYGHCVTITANNLLVIYHVREQDRENVKNSDVDKSDIVEKMVFQKCSIDEILKEAQNTKVSHVQTNCYKQKPTFCNLKVNTPDLHPDILPRNNSVTTNDNSSCTNFMLPKFNSISPINNSLNSNVLQNMDISATLPKKKFEFKKKNQIFNSFNASDTDNIVISCSEISVKADKKDSEIWKNVLEDVDTDSLFGDF